MKGNSAENNKVLAGGLSLKFEIEEDNARFIVNNKVKKEIKEEIDEIEEQTNLRTEENFFTIKSEVGDNSDDVFCSSCKKLFSTSKLLEEHITTYTGCKFNENLENIKIESKVETVNTEELSLTFCNAINNTALSMKLESKENLDGFNHKTPLLQNICSPEKRNFCECCSKSFSSNTEFGNHKQIHLKEMQQLNYLKCIRTEKKSHICDTCNKGFSSKSNLKIHKRSHTGEKPYVCDSCNKGFSQHINLIVHKRSHTGEKPYVCDICERRFIRIHHLRHHIRTHTGEKPYVCDSCNKRFSQASNLKVHKRLHTGEKPYVCDICDKRFAQSSKLTRHKRTHGNNNHFAFQREP